MWIRSRIRLTARQPYASPPGYQSPASGDNIPDPGSQDTTGAQPHHRSAPPSASHNNDNLVNSTPYPLHSCACREVSNANSVSQLHIPFSVPAKSGNGGTNRATHLFLPTTTISCLPLFVKLLPPPPPPAPLPPPLYTTSGESPPPFTPISSRSLTSSSATWIQTRTGHQG